jgi:hypothetical protein
VVEEKQGARALDVTPLVEALYGLYFYARLHSLYGYKMHNELEKEDSIHSCLLLARSLQDHVVCAAMDA